MKYAIPILMISLLMFSGIATAAEVDPVDSDDYLLRFPAYDQAPALLPWLSPSTDINRVQITNSEIDYSGQSTGEIISNIIVPLNPDTSATFTLYFLDCNTMSGSINYTAPTLTSTRYTMGLDGDTTTIDTGALGYHSSENFEIAMAGEANEYQNGTQLDFDISFGFYEYTGSNGIIVISPYIDEEGYANNALFANTTSNVFQYPVYRVELETPGELPVKLFLQDYGDYVTYMEKLEDDAYREQDDNPIDVFINIVTGVYSTIFMLFWVFDFIFIDHFFVIFLIYELAVLAYAANNSKDVFMFVKKAWRYNKTIFEFMLQVVQAICDIIFKIVNALKPW